MDERVTTSRDGFALVAHVLLERAGTVYLLRRSGAFMPGFWVPPGGGVRAGEGLRAAAARECAEEVGVGDLLLRPRAALGYRQAGGQGANFVFTAQSWRGEPGIAEPERFDAAGWFAADALPDPHPPWVAAVLRDGLDSEAPWFGEFGP